MFELTTFCRALRRSMYRSIEFARGPNMRMDLSATAMPSQAAENGKENGARRRQKNDGVIVSTKRLSVQMPVPAAVGGNRRCVSGQGGKPVDLLGQLCPAGARHLGGPCEIIANPGSEGSSSGRIRGHAAERGRSRRAVFRQHSLSAAPMTRPDGGGHGFFRCSKCIGRHLIPWLRT